MSLPSPGSHWKVSLPAPRRAVSLPCWPSMKSLLSPPMQQVDAVAAQQGVVAGAAVGGDLDQGGEVAGAGEAVVAAVGVEDEVLAGADVEEEGRGVDAVEADARAVGGDREALGAVAAVDLDGVDAVVALDDVGVVAGVPDEAVVADAEPSGVVAGAAGDRVVVVVAVEHVDAAAADQHVVAEAAAERQADHAGRQAGRLHVSLPPRALTVRRSLASSAVGDVDDGGQAGDDVLVPAPVTVRLSMPLVAFTMTLSGWASPVPPPKVPARSMFTCVTSVPARSFTVTMSVPPRALRSSCLDVVDVHDDVAEVAGEAQARRRWPRSRRSPTPAIR